MKKALLSLLLCSCSLFGQELAQPTWSVAAVPNENGKITQYSFNTNAGFFWVTKQELKYKLGGKSCVGNCLQIQTVGGVTQLYLQDSHSICGSGCTYQGTFSYFKKTLNAEGPAFYWSVEGSLVGTFTDPNGVTYQNVAARFYFETNPASFQDELLTPSNIGPGGLTVVLGLD